MQGILGWLALAVTLGERKHFRIHLPLGVRTAEGSFAECRYNYNNEEVYLKEVGIMLTSSCYDE